MANSMDDSSGTRARLVDTAAEVFAEKGFQNATVRDICNRAKCNSAAINYHFGDKENLYSLVLEKTDQWVDEVHPLPLKANTDIPVETRLKAAIHVMMQRLFTQGRASYHDKLMSSEMIQPTNALNAAVDKLIRPKFDQFTNIIREFLGEQFTDLEVRIHAMNVVGLCMHFHRCRPAIERLFPDFDYSDKEIEMLATQIARFALAALKNLSDNLE